MTSNTQRYVFFWCNTFVLKKNSIVFLQDT